MTTTIKIYHQVGDGMFHPFNADTSVLEYAYGYTVDSEPSLDQVYRTNNAVDGNEYCVTYEARSLSVGDVFVLHNTSYGNQWFAVDSFGFDKLTEGEFLRALGRNLAHQLKGEA